jgi:hypothetical protein
MLKQVVHIAATLLSGINSLVQSTDSSVPQTGLDINSEIYEPEVQGDSNMTGTDLCVNKPHKSRSYLNHLV